MKIAVCTWCMQRNCSVQCHCARQIRYRCKLQNKKLWPWLLSDDYNLSQLTSSLGGQMARLARNNAMIAQEKTSTPASHQRALGNWKVKTKAASHHRFCITIIESFTSYEWPRHAPVLNPHIHMSHRCPKPKHM